jgi:putative FmdB family regulatory protein
MFYDYECEDCKHVQEEEHGMEETPTDIQCERCKCRNMYRVITGGTGFALKGEGWCSTGTASIPKRKL